MFRGINKENNFENLVKDSVKTFSKNHSSRITERKMNKEYKKELKEDIKAVEAELKEIYGIINRSAKTFESISNEVFQRQFELEKNLDNMLIEYYGKPGKSTVHAKKFGKSVTYVL